MQHQDSKTTYLVLSADDDENAHLLLSRAFIKSGVKFSLSNVNDGQEVIRYVSGEGEFSDREKYPLPNLLLLDLKMPRVSGFEVLEFFNTHPHYKTFPVVVFSSSNHDGDVDRAFAPGCHSYVVKPGSFHDLIHLLKELESQFFDAGHGPSTGASGFSRFTVPVKKLDSTTRKNMDSPNPVSDSPEVFRLLVEQVKDYAIFMLDPNGYIRSWNEGARRIKGYESSEIIGKHFSIFYPQIDLDAEKPDFELKMAREMGRYEEEGWRLRKDGSRFWANVLITPLRDSNGKLTGFAKVTRDLTQRKLQEESFQRLLESEERFRLLVEQVRDYAIFILDAKGNINSWNQGARRIKGYSSEEVIGKHFSMFYLPADLKADKPAKEMAAAIREGRYEEEGWRLKKDGSRFWASVVLTALWDKRGNLTGFAKVTRDLTDRKKEEDALRQKTEELETFAHTLSHDLRAPLRSISSFAQILKADAKDLTEAEKELYLQKIFKSSQAMENLINDIMSLSQMNMAPAPEETVSLDAVIAESIAMLEGEIKAAQAVVNVQGPLPTIKGNRTLLVQVFSNLLGNAVKFGPQGQPARIEVFSKIENYRCNIHVKDNGVGIPQHFHESIFNIFERGEATGSNSGTGVGLAIVKKAVERLGGAIALKSKKGVGSEFIVTVPCISPVRELANDAAA